eukprot:scaffold47723_cov12-Tisochrysis_lutea.AAC.1
MQRHGLRFFPPGPSSAGEESGRLVAPALKNLGKGLLSFRPLPSLHVQGSYESEDSSFSTGDSSPASSLEDSQIESSDEESWIEQGQQAKEENKGGAEQGMNYKLEWYAWQPCTSADPLTPSEIASIDIASSSRSSSSSSSLFAASTLIACLQQSQRLPAGSPLSAQQLLHMLMPSLSPATCCLSAPAQPSVHRDAALEAASGAARSCFQQKRKDINIGSENVPQIKSGNEDA